MNKTNNIFSENNTADRPTKVKIVIATHKKYDMPNDIMYIPLHVGAEGKKDACGNDLDLGYLKDNTGDNISLLNPGFCELTGLYWAWKNLEADYIGLVHYRRHFSIKKTKYPFDGILTYNEIKPMLGKIKIFVPDKRKYYIESLYSHYAHTHYSIQLDETKKILEEKYQEYIKSYDTVINRSYGYMFNMMIMEKNLLEKYCIWLFDILFELKKRFEMPELSDYQQRYYGRISEIAFNVWLDYQIRKHNIRRNEIKEIHSIHLERVNWKTKGIAFMQAKLFGKKYEGSF